MASQSRTAGRQWRVPNPGIAISILLVAALWAFSLGKLAAAWRSDAALSHGPLMPVLVGLLIWSRRGELRTTDSGAFVGLALALLGGLLNLAAAWADIVFLQSASLVLVMIGATWAIWGREVGRALAGPLGLLLFTIPWPTTVVERLAFPMQILSSKYSAMLVGMLGIPIQRSGVQLATSNYSVLVAQGCSGLTSLGVLLALGYLTACLTRAPFWAKALLVSGTIPMALFANTIRVSLIVICGHLHGAGLAMWVHDHEAPVLLFICGALLMGLRAGLLAWTRPAPAAEAPA